ncbi:tyrosine-type recombinase/integrase [Aquamicrobium zhengzhouense]|uniref:Integrase arm-type DNA-binding domain-containing protein n=1 Tax=Aquamicrobium zhengzhouense TaxID=2781738 RepID=A0ABS0SC39_9HYPH|nr:integrase arm-type DNA-binding domain-containing protein [Aquamicrobium zhengzhouense]MBI1620003.1 integrase arm-type DNA-binding domain-containing protein [Aquamicrobium zhengzhouense]
MALSDIAIRALKPRDKSYKTADKNGLYMMVSTTGAKLWRMDYRFQGARKTLALGSYPSITLVEARRLCDDTKTLLAQGVDPAHEKKVEKMERNHASTLFKDVGENWYALNLSSWKPSYAVRLRARLVDDVYPQIGNLPIRAIRPQEIVQCVRKIEERGAIEMARRVHDMIRNICALAVAEGIMDLNPARDTATALAPPPPVKHRTAIKAVELPELMGKLTERAEGNDAVTICALQMTVHTFVRTNEIRFAEWHEFEDLGGKKPLWRIPQHRMKVKSNKTQPRGDHLVPLTPATVAIIERVRKINGDSKYVFRSPTTKADQPISENAMLFYLYRIGYSGRATVHGFRSTASTVLNEHEFNPDWIEMQLAHIDASIRGVYNAALYLNQRREMMLWWSRFVETGETDRQVKPAPEPAPEGKSKVKARIVIEVHDDIDELL